MAGMRVKSKNNLKNKIGPPIVVLVVVKRLYTVHRTRCNGVTLYIEHCTLYCLYPNHHPHKKKGRSLKSRLKVVLFFRTNATNALRLVFPTGYRIQSSGFPRTALSLGFGLPFNAPRTPHSALILVFQRYLLETQPDTGPHQ